MAGLACISKGDLAGMITHYRRGYLSMQETKWRNWPWQICENRICNKN